MKPITLALCLMLPAGAAFAAQGDTAHTQLQGKGITGEVRMLETASGAILVTLRAKGVPPGEHGFHVHETGKCDAADGFKSAGGHVANGTRHGVQAEGGPHPGDLPNVTAQDDGVVVAEFFTRGFSLGQQGERRIFDDDGSAVILHAKADDYKSQPSGEAGDRIACGVLAPGK